MDARSARVVYQVLIEECGAAADEHSIDAFVHSHRDSNRVQEYRFCGSLGFGGKFWQERMEVTCYPEDSTPAREAAISQANARLALLHAVRRDHAVRVAAAGKDRTVHGMSAHSLEIVRYDRSGKWYLESPVDRRTATTLDDAVRAAVLGKAYLKRPGGLQFDARVRQLTGTPR